ncbi:DUF2637 domain-containing protein [Kitasatospora sp. NPDC059599]|uniref:DUF2637 domain-containing protein n=1 Tax=Kitasatospora sp. NPDC059599 TaxID=3346880 RepID=UPI0036876163
MPAAQPTRYGAFARAMITLVMAVIAALAFTFSFGNVWALALRLGVPHPVAPLIAPMVDLSVVGLLVALHHLTTTGTNPDQLRPATRLMHLCGLLTLALNTAEPILAGHYGRAVLDTVAPALLLGWGAVGPDLLHLLHAPPGITAAPQRADPQPLAGEPFPAPTVPSAASQPPAAPAHEPEPAEAIAVEPDDHPAKEPTTGPASEDPHGEREPVVGGRRTGRKPAASLDELAATARPAVEQHGPTHTVIRTALREAGLPASNERISVLVQRFKNEQPDAPEASAEEADVQEAELSAA